MLSRRPAIALTVVLLLGACGTGENLGASSTTTTVSPTTPTTAAPTTTTSTTDPLAGRVIALAPDGLLLVDAGTGSTIPLTFGAAQDEVLGGLIQILGQPTDQGVGTSECPNGQDWAATWADSIQVSFADGGFLSWNLRPGSTLTDLTGVGLGTSLAAITAVQFTTFQSSLGVEFTDGTGMGGVLSDSTPNAVVTALWAGQPCIFR